MPVAGSLSLFLGWSLLGGFFEAPIELPVGSHTFAATVDLNDGRTGFDQTVAAAGLRGADGAKSIVGT